MPRQGQSVESCIITAWHKKKGDKVAEGEILYSYETDKSAFDEPSLFSGTLLEVFVEEGDVVPCLDPVCIIGEEGEDISSLLPKKDAPAAEEKKEEVLSDAVYLFATPTCPNCKIACAILDKAGFAYEKLYATEHADLAVKLGVKQAPTLVIVKDGSASKFCGVSDIKKFLNA